MSWFTFRHEAMATHFEIAVSGHPEAYAEQAATAAFREIDRLEGELSRFVPSSDIARCNRLPNGKSLVIGDDALECLIIAADVAIATQGAFDAAYDSVRSADWDRALPPFQLEPTTHTLTSRATELRLDLGAVGKGYALDQAAEVLAEWGATSACLVAGGSSVLALDPPAEQSGWRVGIGDEPAVRAIVLRRQALSASGIAVKGAHLIDPRSRRPANRTVRTWALAPNAAQSDALSTAFFVFTDAEVVAFCVTHPTIGAAVSGPQGALQAHGALRPLVGSA